MGSDAIWSHRWNLGNVFELEGTSSSVPNWGGLMAAYDYTIQPIDAAAGVAAHEYGHDPVFQTNTIPFMVRMNGEAHQENLFLIGLSCLLVLGLG